MNKFLILAICMTTLSGCVIQRGMHVRTGEYRQPSDAESVRIYGREPSSYKVLGMVRGEVATPLLATSTAWTRRLSA